MSPAVRKELDRIVSSLRTLEEAIGRINEEGRRQESEANGFATPAGPIRSSQNDAENEPFPDADRRRSEGESK